MARAIYSLRELLLSAELESTDSTEAEDNLRRELLLESELELPEKEGKDGPEADESSRTPRRVAASLTARRKKETATMESFMFVFSFGDRRDDLEIVRGKCSQDFFV